MKAELRTALLLGLGACGRIAFEPADGGMALDQASEQVSSDLLVHFTFESDGLLHDRGSGPDATCTSCPSSVGGMRQGTSAAAFDGTNCLHVSAASTKPETYTFAVWEQQVSMVSSSMFGKPLGGATDGSNSFEIYSMSGATLVFLVGGDTTLALDPTLGAWHHLAGVFDGSRLTAYLDGVEVDSTGGLQPQIYADDDILIGCDINGGVEENQFVGSLDEVRLYSRALTATEIAALATP